MAKDKRMLEQIIIDTVSKEHARAVKQIAQIDHHIKLQGMNGYVWFSPENGAFLFNDEWVKASEIYSMIQDSVLKFTSYEFHQGEQMLKYSLNINLIKTV